MNARAAAAALTVLALGLAGCSGGPPIHTSRPDARTDRVPDGPTAGTTRSPRDLQSFREGVLVRVGVHVDRGDAEIRSDGGMRVEAHGSPPVALRGGAVRASARDGAAVRITGESGRLIATGDGTLRIAPAQDTDLWVGKLRVRGTLEISSRADSLFVVNVLPLEDYLRGVVPREIGPRPSSERAAVAAQAVAARTYTVKRLGQYGSLPFDMFATVQDQVYDGVDGENPVADSAIRDTAGLLLVDDHGPIEAYYSSTCGGVRSDIATVWPHREAFDCLRGGPDGAPGREWCAASPHFAWTESWDGRELSRLVREHVPPLLELPPGSVQGDLTGIRIAGRGPSGRAAAIEYTTTAGRWSVPGDRNRWVLRRPAGGILRSVFVELDVETAGGRVSRVTARGRGNGHGVGMCQTGAIGRARAGEDFRGILGDYYPGARIRPIRGDDLPEGRGSAS